MAHPCLWIVHLIGKEDGILLINLSRRKEREREHRPGRKLHEGHDEVFTFSVELTWEVSGEGESLSLSILHPTILHSLSELEASSPDQFKSLAVSRGLRIKFARTWWHIFCKIHMVMHSRTFSYHPPEVCQLNSLQLVTIPEILFSLSLYAPSKIRHRNETVRMWHSCTYIMWLLGHL